MTVWTRTVCLKTGVVLRTVSKDCSYFIRGMWGHNYTWVLNILHEATPMPVWTRMVCLKTGAVLQTVSKDCNYFMRRICFQEFHNTVQYVRYGKIISAKKENKRLLNFWRKYMTFKSKQWLNLRVQMSLSFSWILLLVIIATKIVGGKF